VIGDLQCVVLDCPDALGLARFYRSLLGATLLDAGADTRGWRIYADPAGHPFCLVRH
jgi:hypothetical protein